MMAADTLYKINIVKTLYQFDEPILFVAKIGMFSSLFLKTDETDDGQEFISCYIDDGNIEGLIDGRLSIRGAFEAQIDNYLVYANSSYDVTREFKAAPAQLADRLPERNVGVFEHLGECPDVLQEKDAFLSIYFRGEQLNRDHIPYSTLMKLLGSVQGFARNVVMPPSLRGMKTSTFDFLVGDPALGSLMVSIKEPTFNLNRLRQTQNNRELTRDELRIGANNHKDEFFAEVAELVESPERARIESDDVEESIYENIKHLLPSDETPYSNVTFSTQNGERLQRISISRERADIVRASYENSNHVSADRWGAIIEINAPSATILIRVPAGAVTTCSFTREAFAALRANPAFRIGGRIALAGELYERPRRDFLSVKSIISLEPGAGSV